MAKRALIIRPDYEPLAGFAPGAACMAQVLRSRGFEIETCEGARATRTGTLRALDELIGGAADGDAVAVYYVGHGGLCTNNQYTPDDIELPRYVQHICPSDFAATADGDFRGISTFELSLRLAALTRRTRNVTVILECCFAARMVRGNEPSTPERVQPKKTQIVLTRHLQELRERSRDFAALEITGNPHAVRVAAAGQIEGARQVRLRSSEALKAIGIDLPDGSWVSGMTLRLAEILAEIGDAQVTWRSIAPALRGRFVVQRPEIEGPVSRVPFSLATVDAATPGVRMAGDGAILDAGQLLGVTIGDVYCAMPPGSTELDPSRVLAELTIDETTALHSRAHRIAWRTGERTLPAHAVAIARSHAFARYPVRVVVDSTAQPAPGATTEATTKATIEATIEATIGASSRVRPAVLCDHALAELRVRGAELELRDELGPLFPPVGYPDRLRDAVADLENLATARHLREMSEDAGVAPDDVSVELLCVTGGGRRALADHGEPLGLGDRLALRLENRTPKPVFANVFNIGLRGRIALLTIDASGIPLPSRASIYVGDAIDGKLAGLVLHWPRGMPRDQPRLDTLMVVITPKPADLRALESTERLITRARGAASPLQALFSQIARGGTRSANPEPSAPPEFALCWRDYLLVPLDGPLDLGAIQVDASPTGSARPSAAAATVRIRLAALDVVPGTRLDVLVCAHGAPAGFQASTVLDAAPGSLAVWTGAVRGAVDVYAWTSTGAADRRTLAELLAAAETAEALAALRGPGAALAAGASLRLAAIARAELHKLAPGVTTAFRGSFSAGDPASQRFETKAASFAIAIETLDG